MSSFGLTKQLAVFPFFDSRALLKNGRCGGIDLCTSRLQSGALPSELHPYWGKGQLMTYEAFLLSMQWLNSFLLHMDVKLALSMRVINPCVSQMPIACPPYWHTSLVGSRGAVYVDSLISIVMFPPTSFWGKPWWFGTPIIFSTGSVLF